MSVRSYPLTVDRVEPLTGDSAAITFAVPDALAGVFAFAPGQFLTVGHGAERRSYSICAPAGAPPRIGVREVPGGAVSGWLVRSVRAGDVIDVQPPAGRFTPDLTAGGRHVAIAAGSGITPVLSIAASVLAASPDSEFTLLFGNRRSSTVMFADDIADLKDAHPARMRTVHVLSREPQEIELLSGRLDADRLKVLLPSLVSADDVDHWWLCGPYGLVTGAAAVLGELGADARRIHRELFWVEDEPPEIAAHEETPVTDGAAVTVTLDGRSTTFTLPAGTPVLDGAQRVRPGMPFACKSGVCGTCRARVTAGTAVMRRNYALEGDETGAGYVLTCQALPSSGELAVDYDA
ncbi:MAG: 2Fe-2S iron-sulfur cluster-binding protein [Streptosporangiales bacterium]|nr:2Fe-2S iron-sulfur cluster-binding protein [Streptosporangiales bacterium]